MLESKKIEKETGRGEEQSRSCQGLATLGLKRMEYENNAGTDLFACVCLPIDGEVLYNI